MARNGEWPVSKAKRRSGFAARSRTVNFVFSRWIPKSTCEVIKENSIELLFKTSICSTSFFWSWLVLSSDRPKACKSLSILVIFFLMSFNSCSERFLRRSLAIFPRLGKISCCRDAERRSLNCCKRPVNESNRFVVFRWIWLIKESISVCQSSRVRRALTRSFSIWRPSIRVSRVRARSCNTWLEADIDRSNTYLHKIRHDAKRVQRTACKWYGLARAIYSLRWPSHSQQRHRDIQYRNRYSGTWLKKNLHSPERHPMQLIDTEGIVKGPENSPFSRGIFELVRIWNGSSKCTRRRLADRGWVTWFLLSQRYNRCQLQLLKAWVFIFLSEQETKFSFQQSMSIACASIPSQWLIWARGWSLDEISFFCLSSVTSSSFHWRNIR